MINEALKLETIEYYDRKNDYHGIGTFIRINDNNIKKGQTFIVPPSNIPQVKYIGCLEGRSSHPAYLKPLLLVCMGTTDTHIISEGYGSFIRDICFMEYDDYNL